MPGKDAEGNLIPWTREEALAAAKKGGEASKARAKVMANLSSAEKARAVINRRLERLAGQLVAAALGEGDYDKLTSKERMVAVIKALEWGIGKPVGTKPLDLGSNRKEEAAGLEIE